MYEYLCDLPDRTDLKPLLATGIAGEFDGPEESAGPLSELVAANMWRECVRAAVESTFFSSDWGEGAEWQALLPGVAEDLLPPAWGLAVPHVQGRVFRRNAPISDQRRSLVARLASRLINLAPFNAYGWIERCRQNWEWTRPPSTYPRWAAREYPDDVRRALETARAIMRGEM